MIVDSSVVVAMLKDEPEARRFAELIAGQSQPMMSAGNYLEASIVIDKDRNAVVSAKLDALISELAIEIVPVTADQARIARQAMPGAKVLNVKLLPSGIYAVTLRGGGRLTRVMVDGRSGDIL